MNKFDLHPFAPRGQAPASVGVEAGWRQLYRVGALAALLTVVLTVLSMPVYFVWPLPGLQATTSTVLDYYTIFQSNWLRGLFDLDLVMLVATILVVPLNLALFMCLRRTSQSWMAIALAVSLMGSAAYLAINPAFTLLNLSNTYATTAEVQRPLLVAAGQTTLANYQGTGFDMYYIWGAFSILIMSVVMLCSTVFNKLTGTLGLITGTFMLVPPTVGMVGVVLAFLSLIPMLAWYLLLAWRLWQLGQSVSPAAVPELVGPQVAGTSGDGRLTTPGNGHQKETVDAL